ncbi:MAG: 16S rRNA (guanine(966)-N(2))-methyltransferase RsmD [Clostridia bacterium]|nr:16S rRNA (guanine(966)-N(2))-methyltransferase RsmD [Clostridia bacterium]
MRIITGTARGYRLQTLPGEDTTRPTTERVKESVFSALQFEIEGRAVLDLFAGSGQMGLEAMSRGAASCVFVDSSREACAVVKANAAGAKLTKNITVINATAESVCDRLRDKIDIVFLDPPYRAGLIPSLLPKLLPSMRVGGAVVCETDDKTELPETVRGEDATLVLEKCKRYGKTQVFLYRCEAANASAQTDAL